MKLGSFFLVLICSMEMVLAQNNFMEQDRFLLKNRINQQVQTVNKSAETDRQDDFPTPKSVLFKSLMIPGWGQIENGQIWKVPIIYGMFTGVGIYTIYLNNQYKDYRAAFFNITRGEDSDFRFGPTPERLAGLNPNQLQTTRNSFRNQRDFMFVVMGLAYGLNVIDAYVFAHMRSFDVSDDLSAKTSIYPDLLENNTPGFTLSISLQTKKYNGN